MRRPSAARQALRFSPSLEARWGDSPGVECVPFVAAGAEPFVFLSVRPAAERASEARRFRSAELLLFFKLAIYSSG